MKTLKTILFLWILAIACLLLAGCSALDGMYDREVVKVPGEVISTNVVYKTNVVTVQAAHTNDAGVVSPQKIAHVVQPEIVVQYAPATYVTNLAPRAGVQSTIQASGALPAPWAGTAALALGWLYSTYASVRNKQVAKALAQSVQIGREFLQSTPEGQQLDRAFKEKLQKHQEYVGVAERVRDLLDAYVPGHTQRKD